MKRRIKTVPIILLLLLVATGAFVYFVVIPNKSGINEFFREKEIIYYEHEYWTTYDSPYHFDQHIIIEQGAQLTIDPGVKIFLGPNAKFTVFGQLIANGEPDSPITFAGERPEAGHWEGIIFTAFCGVDDYYERAHPVLQHCLIRDARQAIKTEGCPIDVSNCWFQNNEKTLEINQTANISVKNNFFLSCNEALRVHQEVALSNLDLPEITGNEFEQCQSILLEGSVDFGHNYIHHSGSEYGAITIAPPDSHRVIFHHNRLADHERALEISSLRNVSVDITDNCFDNNDIHIYMDCNNSSEANLSIRDNNFLKENQFKIKAIEGCTDSEQEKIDVSGNYWGTNNKSSILESFWNYSSASSIRIFSYRFIPFPCKWENEEANSENAVLPVTEKEVPPEEEKSLEESLDEINENLKNKLDSIRLGFLDKIDSIGSTTTSTSFTLNGVKIDSLFPEINRKIAEGKSIKITIDENGNLVTTEYDNAVEEAEVNDVETGNFDCTMPEIPEDALYTKALLTGKDDDAKHVFVCPYGSYFTYYKSKRTIYVGKSASAYLMNTDNHTIYVEKGGRLRVNLTSKGNRIYHHPDARISGELNPPHVVERVECGNLDFSIYYLDKCE